MFYHLERAEPGDVLPELLDKSLSRGWSVWIRCASEEQSIALDTQLWTYREDSFLPHGRSNALMRQPVWLSLPDETATDRDILFDLTDRTFDVDLARQLKRSVRMIGAENLDASRQAWKDAKAAEFEAAYWRQKEGGGWTKVA